MHSSGMLTARLLTVSQHALGRGRGYMYPSMHWAGVGVSVSQHVLGRGGGCLPGGGGVWPGGVCWEVSVQGGCLPGNCLARGCLSRGCLSGGVSGWRCHRHPPRTRGRHLRCHPHRQKDACENITFAYFVSGQ